MKRLIFILGSLIVIQSCSTKLNYEVNSDNTASVSSCSFGFTDSISIQAEVVIDGEKYPVTSINRKAFEKSNLKILMIPESVKEVGNSAFDKCDNLTTVYIPESVLYIGNAFSECKNLTTLYYNAKNCNTDIKSFDYKNSLFSWCGSLKTLNIGNKVEIIPECAFYKCWGLNSLDIPNSVKCIRENAFGDCWGLESVTIGNSVTDIDNYAFKGCKNIKKISIPNSLKYVGRNVFEGCDNLQYNEYDNAFYIGNDKNPYVLLVKAKSMYITSCNIHPDCRIIYEEAFKGCGNLASIKIPTSIVNIGYKAFEDCEGLKKAEFASIKNLCNIKFDWCSNPLYYARHLYINGTEITNVDIPNTVTHIGDYAFCNCNYLTSVTIPNSVISIGDDAFYCCSIRTISIPNSVKSIGEYAFWGCRALTSAIIPNSIESLGDEAFGFRTVPCKTYDNGFYLGNPKNPYLILVSVSDRIDYQNFDIHDGCKFIHSDALYKSKLRSINIPNTVVGIGKNAFKYCDNLNSVTLGNSLKYIGDNAFAGCKYLSFMRIPNTIEKIGYKAFNDCSLLKYTEYDDALYLGNEDNPYVVLVKAKSNDVFVAKISNKCKIICNGAFENCTHISLVEIPKSVISISDKEFGYATSYAMILCENKQRPMTWGHNWNGCKDVYWNWKIDTK